MWWILSIWTRYGPPAPRHHCHGQGGYARRGLPQQHTPVLHTLLLLHCTRPQQVHITDIMYTLKSMGVHWGFAQTNTASPCFSLTFNEYVFNYGRAFEFGLATRQSLRHAAVRDFPGLAQLGMGMLTKRRINLIPNRIDGLDGLQKILTRADEIEEESR